MIFTNDYFQASCRPKYLNPVCKLMQKSDRVIFLKNNELEIFIIILKRILEQNRRTDSTAYLSASSPEDASGCIQLYAKKDAQDSIARLYFSHIRAVLEYDLDAEDFIDVSEKLEEKGGRQ
jgi:hypothetical protein